jgi:hypothetical protein
MENSWKVVEHIRDRRDEAAWEAAQALARAVLEIREVVLATAIIQGGPFALRRALELAERVIDSQATAAQAVRTSAPKA